MIFKIDGKAIKPPKLGEERYNITKSNRLADGTMSMEIIAKKTKLILSYNSISSKEFDRIMQLIDTYNPFFDVTVDTDGKIKTYRMYVGAIKRDAVRTLSGEEWCWTNVSFNFIER